MKKSTSCKTGGAKRSHRIFALLLTLTVILLTLCLASCGKSEPTAEEYLEKASLIPGLEIALKTITTLTEAEK